MLSMVFLLLGVDAILGNEWRIWEQNYLACLQGGEASSNPLKDFTVRDILFMCYNTLSPIIELFSGYYSKLTIWRFLFEHRLIKVLLFNFVAVKFVFKNGGKQKAWLCFWGCFYEKRWSSVNQKNGSGRLSRICYSWFYFFGALFGNFLCGRSVTTTRTSDFSWNRKSCIGMFFRSY